MASQAVELNKPKNQKEIMRKKPFIVWCFTSILLLVFFSQQSWGKDMTLVPVLELKGVYDDNLDFDRKDEIDDFGINTIPGLAFDYKSELLQFSLFGELDIINYFKHRASQATKGYQTLINEALREYTGLQNQPGMMTDLVKRVKRLEEELLRQMSG